MKISYLIRIVMIVFVFMVSAGNDFATSSDVQEVEPLKNDYRMQVPFIENKGHIENKEVLFFASTFGGFGTVNIEKNGILVYNFHVKNKPDIVIKEIFTANNMTITPLEPPAPNVIKMFKEKMNIEGEISNYYRISWGEIYKDISLELTASQDTVEKFILVSPGGDPDKINITIKGATKLKVGEMGKLKIMTERGAGKFNKPFAFQVMGDERRAVEISYSTYKSTSYGFKVGRYDKKKPLIIRF